MARIQRIPRGLLSLFGAKTLGQNPSEYDNNLRLTYDTTEHYLDPLTFTQVSDNAVSAISAVAQVVVPAGESWLIKSIGTFVGRISGTVDELAFVPRVILPGQTVQASWGTTWQHRQATAFVGFASQVTFTPLLVASGATIESHVQQIAGTAPVVAVNTQVVFRVLDT